MLVPTKNIRRCYVIGNGHSRKNYSIDTLTWPKFGCNQIYQDHRVDYLLAQDGQVLRQMERDRVAQTVYVPFKKWRSLSEQVSPGGLQIQTVRTDERLMSHWLTGEMAVILAAQLGFDRIKVIGFDGGPDSWYRARTSTNSSLEVCQSHPVRYADTFKRIQQLFPHIIIETDEYFCYHYK